jgi:uncharacterized membrane protein YeiB
MSSLRAPAASFWPLELGNRGLVYALLGLGLAGMLTELPSTIFVPRLVLYLMVMALGVVGLMRCRRAERRHGTAPLATPRLPGSDATATAFH